MSNPGAVTIESKSEAQTIALGRRLGQILLPGDCIAIRGELGAGKTRLVRGIVDGLGHDASAVSSPTFVVMNEYDDPRARLPVVHMDAYRLIGDEELANAGWDRLFDGVTIVIVEWAERIASSLPANRFDITIEHDSAHARRLFIVPPPGRDVSELLRAASPTCRICGADVAADGPSFPFCSPRCRTIDLGKWITGDYKITREIKEADLETND